MAVPSMRRLHESVLQLLVALLIVLPSGVSAECWELGQDDCCGLLCIGSLNNFRFCNADPFWCDAGCAVFFSSCQTCTWCGIGYCTSGTDCPYGACVSAPQSTCNSASTCSWCSTIGYCRTTSSSCTTSCRAAERSVCNAASQCSWCASLGGWCRKNTEVCVASCASLTPRGRSTCNAVPNCQWCTEHNGRCKKASELCLTETQPNSNTADTNTLSVTATASTSVAVASTSFSSSMSMSASSSRSQSMTGTSTLSPTFSASTTTTETPLLSLTTSASYTRTISASFSFSVSRTRSPTASVPPSLTSTASATRSASRTASTSPTTTASVDTQSAWQSASITLSPTVTRSETVTSSTAASRTRSTSQSVSPTTAASTSASASMGSVSNPATLSATVPASGSTTATLSSTQTASPSSTPSASSTASPTRTSTPSATLSVSPTSTKTKSTTSTDSLVDMSPRIHACFSEQSVFANSEFVVTVSGLYLAEPDMYLIASNRSECLDDPRLRSYHGIFWLSVDRTRAAIRYTVNNTEPFSICYRSVQLGRVFNLSCPQVFFPQVLAPWANVTRVHAAASAVVAIPPATSLAAFNFDTCVSAYFPSVNMNPSRTGGILSSPVAGSLQFGNASQRIRPSESCMFMVAQGPRAPPGSVPTVDSTGWNALNASSVFDLAFEFRFTSYLSDDDVLLLWMPSDHPFVASRNSTNSTVVFGNATNSTANATSPSPGDTMATSPSCPSAIPGYVPVHRVAYGASALRLPSSEAFMITACSSVGAARGQYAAVAYSRTETVCPNDCRDGTGIQRGVCDNSTATCLCMHSADGAYGLGGIDCARPTTCNSMRTNTTTNITDHAGFWTQQGVGHCAALLRADGRFAPYAGGFCIGIHVTRFNLTNPNCSVAAVVLRRGGPSGTVLRRLCAADTETVASDASPTIVVLETERVVHVEYLGSTETDVLSVSFASIATSCPGIKDVAGFVQPSGHCGGRGDCVAIDLRQLRQLPLSTKACACFHPWGPSQPGASCDACGYGRELWTYPTCGPIPTCAWDCNGHGTCTSNGCRCRAPYYGRVCELTSATAHVQAAYRMATRVSFDRGSGAATAVGGSPPFLSCQLTTCRTVRRSVGNGFYAASADALIALANDNNTAPGATAPQTPDASADAVALPPPEAVAARNDYFALSAGSGSATEVEDVAVEGDEGIVLNPVRTPNGAGDYFAQGYVAGTPLDVHGATTVTVWAKLTRGSNGFLFAKVDTARYADGRIPLLEMAFHDVQNRHAPLETLHLRYTNTSIYFAVYVNGDRGRIDVMAVDVGRRDGEVPIGGTSCSTQTCGSNDGGNGADDDNDDFLPGARASGRDAWFYARHFALNGKYRSLLFDGHWHFLALTMRRGAGRWEGQIYIDGGTIDGNANFVQCLPFLPSAVSNFSQQHAEANAMGDPEVTVVEGGGSVVMGYGISGALDEARLYSPGLTQMSLVKIGGPGFNAALSISTNVLLLCSAVSIVTVVGATTLFVARREGVRLDDITHEQRASSGSSSSSDDDDNRSSDDEDGSSEIGDGAAAVQGKTMRPQRGGGGLNSATSSGSVSSDDGFYDLIAGGCHPSASSQSFVAHCNSSSEFGACKAVHEDDPAAALSGLAGSERRVVIGSGVAEEGPPQPTTVAAPRKRSDATAGAAALPGLTFFPSARRRSTGKPLQLEDVDATNELVMDATLECSIDWDDGGDCDGADGPTRIGDGGADDGIGWGTSDGRRRSSVSSTAWPTADKMRGESSAELPESSGKNSTAQAAHRPSWVSFTGNPLATRAGVSAQREDSMLFNGASSGSFFGTGNNALNSRQHVGSFLEDKDARRLYRAMSVRESRGERANRKLRSALVAVTNTLTTSAMTTSLGGADNIGGDALTALSEGIAAALHAWQTLGLHVGGFPWPEVFEANVGNVLAFVSLSFETSLDVSFELGFYICGGFGLAAFAVQVALLLQDALPCRGHVDTDDAAKSLKAADGVVVVDAVATAPRSTSTTTASDGDGVDHPGAQPATAAVEPPPRSIRATIAWASLFTLTTLYMPITRYAVIGAFCYRTIQCEFDCYNEPKHWRIVYVSAVLMLCVTLFTPLLLLLVTFLKRRQFAGNRIDDGQRDGGDGLVSNRNNALERDWRQFLVLDRSPYAGAYESFKFQWVYFQTMLIVSKALCVFLALGLDSNTAPQMIGLTLLHSVFALAVALASPFIADVSNLITVLGQVFLVGTLAVNAISRIDPDETVGIYSGYALIGCVLSCIAIQATLLGRHLSPGDIVDGVRAAVATLLPAAAVDRTETQATVVPPCDDTTGSDDAQRPHHASTAEHPHNSFSNHA